MAEPQALVDLLGPPDSELVLGLVGPTGVDLDGFEQLAASVLKQFGYQTRTWSLSQIASKRTEIGDAPATASEFERISFLQKAGTQLRHDAGTGNFLALAAMAEISQQRPLERERQQPLRKTAHILRSLKHPDEVEALRRVYGVGFFLIGLHAPHSTRLDNLVSIKGMTPEQAEQLMSRDQSEDDPLGQQTRKTFYLSDAFITDGDKKQLLRFLELVFGSPFLTPTPDEYAMFLAFAAAMRSAQPGRQVGAVVVSADGEAISTGSNDVPCYGGGLYWSTCKRDARDHKWKGGVDSNKAEIARIAADLRSQLSEHLKPETAANVVDLAVKRSRLKDITEFGRAVHAEMEALIACGRIGVSARGGTLYTTTFPCHNCAKHIVAAGIEKVVYVEPYPKSRAYELHEDSIATDTESASGKVRFVPFVGIAARRYFDLFSVRLGSGSPLERQAADGAPTKWKRATASVRPRMSPWSYIDRERRAIDLITHSIESAEPANVDEK